MIATSIASRRRRTLRADDITLQDLDRCPCVGARRRIAMTSKIPNDALIVGRDGVEVDPPAKPEKSGTGGHPLPADGKARRGSIPESLEKKKGYGAN
jgi:hypothetical protein